jgi:hypothetical protein
MLWQSAALVLHAAAVLLICCSTQIMSCGTVPCASHLVHTMDLCPQFSLSYLLHLCMPPPHTLKHEIPVLYCLFIRDYAAAAVPNDNVPRHHSFSDGCLQQCCHNAVAGRKVLQQCQCLELNMGYKVGKFSMLNTVLQQHCYSLRHFCCSKL